MASDAEMTQPDKHSPYNMQLWGQIILADQAFLRTLSRDLQILTTRFPEQAAPLNCLMQQLVTKGFLEQFLS